MRITKVPRLALLGVAFLLVVGFLLIVPLLSVTRFIPENRTFIVGWEVDPPDQIATNTGEPTGFAVELVREGARRRGIRLKWVKHRESSEAALRSKAVDLWPMMTITEERKKFFHMTDPYQENEFGLFVDANSAFMTAGDLKQQLTLSTAPCGAKRERSDSSVAPKSKLPTKIFFTQTSFLFERRAIRGGTKSRPGIAGQSNGYIVPAS